MRAHESPFTIFIVGTKVIPFNKGYFVMLIQPSDFYTPVDYGLVIRSATQAVANPRRTADQQLPTAPVLAASRIGLEEGYEDG